MLTGFHQDPGVALRVHMEDPNPNRPLFLRRELLGPGPEKERARAKVAQNVGMNKRDAQLILAFCHRHGIKITTHRPQKGSMTKLSQEAFKRLTRWPKSTNEHGRDAGMLIMGRF